MMIICHREGNARLMEVLKISRNTLVEDYYRVLKRKVYQLGPFLRETICDNTLLSQKYQYLEILATLSNLEIQVNQKAVNKATKGSNHILLTRATW